jgi:glycosyltransferase involved in cell wall biosynthesis
MKLAVFSGQYFWFDGKHYSTDEAFVKFVTSFGRYFEKIVFCDPVKEERKTQAYILDPMETEVCPLPYFGTYAFWKNLLVIYPKIYRVIRDNIQHWDIIWLPGPHPVALLFTYICLIKRKPFFQVVRANLMEQVRHRNEGIKMYCAVAVAALLEYVSQRLARKCLTFTVGKEMYKKYERKGGHVCQTAISLVSEREIEDTPRTKSFELHKPVRLLSVGRLDREKGLHFLIEAVEELILEKRLGVVLQIAGKGLRVEEERRLRRAVKKRKLTRCIRFMGYAPHGPKLFKLYRESDIFVLPSLSGEGFPQTLFEAMACGVPIIATKVAGIPNVIENGENGLLVEPASPSGICEAVQRIVGDPELRMRLATNGVATVRNHTLEAERDRMMSPIQRLLSSGKSLGAHAEQKKRHDAHL